MLFRLELEDDPRKIFNYNLYHLCMHLLYIRRKLSNVWMGIYKPLREVPRAGWKLFIVAIILQKINGVLLVDVWQLVFPHVVTKSNFFGNCWAGLNMVPNKTGYHEILDKINLEWEALGINGKVSESQQDGRKSLTVVLITKVVDRLQRIEIISTC